MHNSLNTKEKPLITFCLFAYNQERYIKEAIEGALNQTYTPLEVILSDDCSTDSTFVYIQAMVREYKGPHKVILNRNKKNLGLAEHVNYVASIASGEWLVFAAGDDVSLPERTSVLFELIKSERDVYYAGSGVLVIDERGKPISNGVLEFDKKLKLSGCMAAYNKKCFELFDRLHPKLTVEDFILPYRALLLGNIVLINRPLVQYRVITNDFLESYRKYAQFSKGLEYVFFQRNVDLRKMAYRYPSDTVKTIMQQNNKFIQNARKDYKNKELIIDIYDAALLSKIRLLIKNKTFSRSQKIKMFLLSYKLIRIMQGYHIKCFRKTAVKSFTNCKTTINLNQLLSKKFTIEAYNDIEI